MSDYFMGHFFTCQPLLRLFALVFLWSSGDHAILQASGCDKRKADVSLRTCEVDPCNVYLMLGQRRRRWPSI